MASKKNMNDPDTTKILNIVKEIAEAFPELKEEYRDALKEFKKLKADPEYNELKRFAPLLKVIISSTRGDLVEDYKRHLRLKFENIKTISKLASECEIIKNNHMRHASVVKEPDWFNNIDDHSEKHLMKFLFKQSPDIVKIFDGPALASLGKKKISKIK